MSTDKKKGDFDQWQKESEGGDKKAHEQDANNSRTASKQNAGHGGHK